MVVLHHATFAYFLRNNHICATQNSFVLPLNLQFVLRDTHFGDNISSQTYHRLKMSTACKIQSASCASVAPNRATRCSFLKPAFAQRHARPQPRSSTSWMPENITTQMTAKARMGTSATRRSVVAAASSAEQDQYIVLVRPVELKHERAAWQILRYPSKSAVSHLY